MASTDSTNDIFQLGAQLPLPIATKISWVVFRLAVIINLTLFIASDRSY